MPTPEERMVLVKKAWDSYAPYMAMTLTNTNKAGAVTSYPNFIHALLEDACEGRLPALEAVFFARIVLNVMTSRPDFFRQDVDRYFGLPEGTMQDRGVNSLDDMTAVLISNWFGGPYEEECEAVMNHLDLSERYRNRQELRLRGPPMIQPEAPVLSEKAAKSLEKVVNYLKEKEEEERPRVQFGKEEIRPPPLEETAPETPQPGPAPPPPPSVIPAAPSPAPPMRSMAPARSFLEEFGEEVPMTPPAPTPPPVTPPAPSVAEPSPPVQAPAPPPPIQANLFGEAATPAPAPKLLIEQQLEDKYRPLYIEQVVGNTQSVDVLRHGAETGFGKAYLLEGPPGVGKTSVALAAFRTYLRRQPDAMQLYAEKYSPMSPTFGINPAVLLYRNAQVVRERGGIPGLLSDIARFMKTAGFFPGVKRAIIIDDFTRFDEYQQQELLADLERFPKVVVFIIANSLANLNPAVESRARHLKFGRPSVEEIESRLIDIIHRENMPFSDPASEVRKVVESLGSIREFRQALIRLADDARAEGWQGVGKEEE